MLDDIAAGKLVTCVGPPEHPRRVAAAEVGFGFDPARLGAYLGIARDGDGYANLNRANLWLAGRLAGRQRQ